jgi:hypothetical protein
MRVMSGDHFTGLENVVQRAPGNVIQGAAVSFRNCSYIARGEGEWLPNSEAVS